MLVDELLKSAEQGQIHPKYILFWDPKLCKFYHILYIEIELKRPEEEKVELAEEVVEEEEEKVEVSKREKEEEVGFGEGIVEEEEELNLAQYGQPTEVMEQLRMAEKEEEKREETRKRVEEEEDEDEPWIQPPRQEFAV